MPFSQNPAASKTLPQTRGDFGPTLRSSASESPGHSPSPECTWGLGLFGSILLVVLLSDLNVFECPSYTFITGSFTAMLLKVGSQLAAEATWNFWEMQTDWTLPHTCLIRGSLGNSCTLQFERHCPTPSGAVLRSSEVFNEYLQNWIDCFLLNEPKLQLEALPFVFKDGTNAAEQYPLALRTRRKTHIQRRLLPTHPAFTHLRDFKKQRLLWSVMSELNTSKFGLNGSAQAAQQMGGACRRKEANDRGGGGSSPEAGSKARHSREWRLITFELSPPERGDISQTNPRSTLPGMLSGNWH